MARFKPYKRSLKPKIYGDLCLHPGSDHLKFRVSMKDKDGFNLLFLMEVMVAQQRARQGMRKGHAAPVSLLEQVLSVEQVAV